MPTLLNPTVYAVWHNLIRRIYKAYPNALLQLSTDKDGDTVKCQILRIESFKGGTRENPTIQIKILIEAFKDKVVIHTVSIDTQKIGDRETRSVNYYFPEKSDKDKIDFDRITAYLDKTLSIGLTQILISGNNKLKSFMNTKEPAKRHRFGHVDGFIDESLVEI